MLDSQSEVAEEVGTEETDPLAGEELFEVPPDLADDDTEAPAPVPDADPKGPPADDKEATQPRDEHGKFAPKPKDAPAPDTGQPPVTAQAEIAPTAPPPDTGDEPVMEFSFRADNRQIAIPGSKVTSEGVFIPKEHMAEVQRLASYGTVYQGSFRQRLEQANREVAETKAQVQSETERAKHYLNFMADLFDRTERGETDSQGRTPIEAWQEDFQRNRVVLEADAKLAEARALQERRPAQPDRVEGFEDGPQDSFISEREAEELNNGLANELGGRLQQFARADGIRGLTAAEFGKIQQSMSDPDEIDRYFKVAIEDIPEHGITKGQIVAMDAAIRKNFQYQASLILGARQQNGALAAAEAANRKNGAANPIPAVVTASGNGVPKAAKEVPKFKNREDMIAWLDGVDPLE